MTMPLASVDPEYQSRMNIDPPHPSSFLFVRLIIIFNSSCMWLNYTYHDFRILSEGHRSAKENNPDVFTYAPCMEYWPAIDPKVPGLLCSQWIY